MTALNFRLFCTIAIIVLAVGVFAAAPAPVIGPGLNTTSSTGGATTNGISTLTSQLCGIVAGVRTVIGVVALVMFLIGGILYSIAHFMPAAGQIRSNMQGWSMGMIFGAVVGVVLVLLAPIIINHLLAFGNGISIPQC
ncbi:MAG: hypothetical protein KGH61_00905 [Candidatus Micrarchaeota archaeon]|nr:hypothetical protein [Candidatus Micrarchaeota archaeon]MDE1847493.1 hypothetical protein [Candidatus Micrarchaeota archaeon]MDE1863871.1 hypothetical protein [Candidatus Micrarchaeota archaeon]